MRFNPGEVWKDASGRRAVVVRVDDDGRRGQLMFADTGEEESFNWVELAQAGQWQMSILARASASLRLTRLRIGGACRSGRGGS